MMPLELTVNGRSADPTAVADPLIRAVIVSLFTWRRALPDDELPGDERMGWWGDSYPVEPQARIGSRLWLMSRGKLTNAVPGQARELVAEALQWLIDDGVAERVDVIAERQGLFRLAVGVDIIRGDAGVVSLRFADVWYTFNAL